MKKLFILFAFWLFWEFILGVFIMAVPLQYATYLAQAHHWPAGMQHMIVFAFTGVFIIASFRLALLSSKLTSKTGKQGFKNMRF